jgi:membrane fusion protein
MIKFGLKNFRFYNNSGETHRRLFLIKIFTLVILIWELYVLYTYPYAKKIKVTGEVVSSSMQSPIISPISGVITSVKSKTNDIIKQDDILYAITPSSAYRGGISEIIDSAHFQYRSAANSLDTMKYIESMTPGAYRKEFDSMTKLLENSKEQLNIEIKKSELVGARLTAVESAREAYSQGEIDRFYQAHLESLTSVKRIESSIAEIESRQANLKNAFEKEKKEQHIRTDGLRAELERRKIELFEKDQAQTVFVKAPVGGILLTNHAQDGYVIEQGQTLGTLIINEGINSVPFIKLQVDPQKVRNLNKGLKIAFELPAYPKNHFGFFEGEISSITRPVNLDGKTIIDVLPTDRRFNQKSPNITLAPGMKVEGSIIVERLTLIQWFFESLYSAQKFKEVLR